MLFANQINIESTGGKKIPVGIHSNCRVTSVETGDNFIDFNYEDNESRVHNKRVWFPDPSKITPLENESTQDALTRVTNESLAHIVKHMYIFCSPEEINTFVAADFPSFANKAKQLLASKLDSKRVNLKLIYDNNGQFSTFSRMRPDYIEEYVEGQPVGLAYTKWEQANRTQYKVDDKVTSTDSSILY